jgi:hypothetical protein
MSNVINLFTLKISKHNGMSSRKIIIKFSFLKKAHKITLKNRVFMLYRSVCYKGTFETHTLL